MTPLRPMLRRVAGIAGNVRGLLPLIILMIGWQILADDSALNFPPPSKSIKALEGLGLGTALLQTLRTMTLGLLLATMVGVVFGAVVGSYRPVERAVQPVTDFFRTLPAPVVVPITALIIGPTFKAALAILVLACVWPILLNTAAGMKAVPAVRLEMARAMRLTRPEKVLKVILPSLAPNVFTGVRISVAIALVATLFLELLGVARGVGLVLLERQQRFDSAGVWGIVFVAGIGGYLVNVVLSMIERRVMRHRPEHR